MKDADYIREISKRGGNYYLGPYKLNYSGSFNTFYDLINKNIDKLYNVFLSKKYFTLYSETFTVIFFKDSFKNDANYNDTVSSIDEMIKDIRQTNVYCFTFCLSKDKKKKIECYFDFEHGIHFHYSTKNNLFRIERNHVIDTTNYTYDDYEKLFIKLLSNKKNY